MAGEAQEDENAGRPWQRRPWRTFVGIVVLLLGVLAYVCFTDCAPPDDADLLPAPTTGSDPTNPLATFCREAGNGAMRKYRDLLDDPKGIQKSDTPTLLGFVDAEAADLFGGCEWHG